MKCRTCFVFMPSPALVFASGLASRAGLMSSALFTRISPNAPRNEGHRLHLAFSSSVRLLAEITSLLVETKVT